MTEIERARRRERHRSLPGSPRANVVREGTKPPKAYTFTMPEAEKKRRSKKMIEWHRKRRAAL